jgi:membrane protein implicated in regulation of membrane protease activity
VALATGQAGITECPGAGGVQVWSGRNVQRSIVMDRGARPWCHRNEENGSMLSIYLGSLLFGGVLLGASIFGGHGDGADHGDGGHGDAGHGGHGGDAGHGDGHAHGAGHHHGPHHASQLPFLSLRFWAFALAFFGLSGAALTWSAFGALTPLVAGGVGMGCGLLSSRVLSGLARRPVGLLGGSDAHVGREGRLLLPVEKGTRGKVRLSIGGVSTDLIAETEAEGALAAGETALVVGMRGNVALVERSPASLPPIGGLSIGSKREDS